MKEFSIGVNDAGQRLDKFLTKALPHLPSSMLYKGLRTKKIKLNGKRAAGNDRLLEGDKLTLYLPDDCFAPRSEALRLDILHKLKVVYEDSHVLLVNKPTGMLVHAGDTDQKDEITLIDRIKAYLYQKGDYKPEDEQSFSPALCNRIDRNTAGIVICAKSAAALREINALIRDGGVEKHYLAVIHGIPAKKEDTLTDILEKDEKTHTMHIRRVKTRDNRTAVTHYRIIRSNAAKNISLAEIVLGTGRTHQIRAQFANIGHPLVGDGKYGKRQENQLIPGFPAQALCACKIIFHPTDPNGVLAGLDQKVFAIPDPFCGAV